MEIKQYLSDLPGVTKVHNLRIWAISTTETALTAHLVIPEDVDQPDELLNRVSRELHDHHGISPVTLQIERGDVAPLDSELPGDAASAGAHSGIAKDS